MGAIVAGDAVEGIANANRARCTQQRVLAVAMRRKCLLSHERIGLYIAASVTSRSRKAQVAIVAADLAGKCDEPDQGEPRGFV